MVSVCFFLTFKYWFCSDLVRVKDDKEIKKKYRPFARDDLDKISIFWCFPFYFFTIPRWIIGWINMATVAVVCKLATVSAKDIYNLPLFNYRVIKAVLQFYCYIGLKLVGFTSLTTSKSDIDYKKYLGPDWTPEWEGASTLVCNHTSWIDILVAVYFHYPSFASRASARNIPLLGDIMVAMSTIFI